MRLRDGPPKTPRTLAKKGGSPSGVTRGASCKLSWASVRPGFFWLRRRDSNPRPDG